MIIGLTGLAGSGKDTLAEMLNRPDTHVSFAEPLKVFCQAVFGFTDEELWGPSKARETLSKSFTRPDGTPLTPRFALQTLGTEWGRNCDPDVWAKSGVARAKKMEEALGNVVPVVVITDVRFVNEAKAIREASGEVWRLVRHEGLSTMPQPHASEAEVWSEAMTAYVTHEIHNNTTLENLCRQANVHLKRLKAR